MRETTRTLETEGFVCFCGCSDKVPGPLDGAAEHHAEDHPEDLWRGGDRNTGFKLQATRTSKYSIFDG